MSEILFRGKDVYGKWLYGDLINLTSEIKQICNHTQLEHAHGVNPETVGQFINRTDKKGKKIFVGDIVKYSNGEIGVIRYNENVSAYIVDFGGGDWDYLDVENGTGEVIGNIHDNPELLEVQK